MRHTCDANATNKEGWSGKFGFQIVLIPTVIAQHHVIEYEFQFSSIHATNTSTMDKTDFECGAHLYSLPDTRQNLEKL